MVLVLEFTCHPHPLYTPPLLNGATMVAPLLLCFIQYFYLGGFYAFQLVLDAG